ncbi:acetylglutamate kinase [Tenacibaculum sp. 190130A14a]
MKIIKIGGNIINNQRALENFLTNFHQIEGPKILVHGGGEIASKLAKELNIPVQMIDGRRVTNQANLDIITMVYAGKINKNIVAKLQANQINALGLTGADAQTIVAQKRSSNPINFGYVGDALKINTNTIELLLNHNITPVFCAITHDKNGDLLNTNADTIASEIAIAFGKYYRTELYYCFDKQGVLKDINDPTSVIEKIHFKQYQQLKKRQIIFKGMIPKLDNCFHALQNNVSQVHIGTTEMLFNTTTHTTLQLQ